MYSFDDRYVVFGTNQHIYYYDTAEDTMTDLGTGSVNSSDFLWNNRKNSTTKGFCKLINTSQGVYMYANNTFSLIISGTTSDLVIHDVETGILVCTRSTSVVGLYFIDKETLSCSKVYDYGCT